MIARKRTELLRLGLTLEERKNRVNTYPLCSGTPAPCIKQANPGKTTLMPP